MVGGYFNVPLLATASLSRLTGKTTDSVLVGLP